MFSRREIALGIATLAAASPFSSYAHDIKLRLDPSKLARLVGAFEDSILAGDRAGYAILIQQHGEDKTEAYLGWADLHDQKPINHRTRFRLASLTKPITSVAAMILVEEARLRLSDPLHEYIPEFANPVVATGLGDDGRMITEPARRDPTVADLMSHTAGILGRSSSAVLSSEAFQHYRDHFLDPGDVADMARRIAALPLIAHPGEAWTYGIFATDVLGRIVEVAAGEPLANVVQKRILDPLGMSDTGFLPANGDPDLASIYSHAADGRLEKVETHNLDRLPAPSGGGGLYSTARDYSRFAAMMLNKGILEGTRILSPAMMDLMSRNALSRKLLPIKLEVALPAAGFGLGFGTCVPGYELSHSPLKPGDFWWAGSTDTFFVVSPAHQMTGVILSQYHPNAHTRSWHTWGDFTSLLYGALV